MALTIREGTGTPISQDGSQTNPFITSHNGRTSTVIHKKLNIVTTDQDTETRLYTNVHLTIMPVSGSNLVLKLHEDVPQVPTEAEWATSTVSLNFSDTIYPVESDIVIGFFWVRVEVPAGTSVQNITANSFLLEYDEEAIA